MTRFTVATAAVLSLSLAACAVVLSPPPDSAAAGQQERLLRLHSPSLAGGHGSSRWPPAQAEAAADSIVQAVEAVRGQIHDEFAQAVASIAGGGGGGIAYGHGYADSFAAPTGAGAGADADDGQSSSSDFTIYQLISHSKYTTKFARAVDEHPSVVKLLNSTSANYTLFVPVDQAFDDVPDDHPSEDLVTDWLRYHVGLGEFPARRILTTYTIPTAYDEKWLGGEPQRLRTSVDLSGVKINFYSKVVAADIAAKNGVIHAVNRILVPPPMVGRILTHFPDRFSTLLLAYEKTDFVRFIHGVKMVGSTVFVPTNSAFSWLGPKANAFLFNTEKGLKYLKAILKYHIVPNATLYTDAFYDKREEGSSVEIDAVQREHYDLPTLLGHAHIGVDIARIFGFATMKVNGFSKVTLPDGVAKNGVIQVVDHVPLPPCKHKKHKTCIEQDRVGDVEVEELVNRLEDYV